MPFYNHGLLSHVKHSFIKALNYLVLEESILIFQHLILLYELLLFYLSPPPLLTEVQWGILLCSLQTYVTQLLQ